MKKLFIFSLIFLFTGLNSLKANESCVMKSYPIPSFGVLISGNATFLQLNSSGGAHKERRQLNIKTTSTSHGMENGSIAKVWILNGSGEIVLGPFYLSDGETLSVSADNKWGALVQSETEISVDVWYGNEQ